MEPQLSHGHRSIANRYQLLEPLGEGGSGITYKAKDLQTSEEVALKILSLRQVEDWKQIDLFEREARILQQLDHPRIPKYIDYFIHDNKGDLYYKPEPDETLSDLVDLGIEPDEFYIVQELVTGQTLASLVEKGWKPTEHEVKPIAIEVLNILVYLQELLPPVTHRDLKPQNLIRTERGEIFLVDFGGVRDRLRQTTVASSVVGTYGYMSPEQLRGGKTYLSTDLYGLGATLIYLLTGEHPVDLPRKRLKIDFHDRVTLSSGFRNWLDRLIEPNYQDRLPSARVALDILQGKARLKAFSSSRLEKPSYSFLKLVKSPEKLIISIPSASSRKRYDYPLALTGILWYATLFSILGIFAVSFGGRFFIILVILFYWRLITRILSLRIINESGKQETGAYKTKAINAIIIGCIFAYLVWILMPFLINKNPYLCFTILLLLSVFASEIIVVKYLQPVVREFLIDTILEITPDLKLSVRQKLLFFSGHQDYSENLIETIERNFCRLLTPDERRWLMQQIDDYLTSSPATETEEISNRLS